MRFFPRSLVVIMLTCMLALVASCASNVAAPKAAPLVVGTGAPAADAPPPARASAPEDDAVVPITAKDAVRGSRLAIATLVIFSDFQCPFCSRLVTTVDRLQREYGEDKLRIVFKHDPLPFHQHARQAAEVGQAVLELAGSDAFWRYHDNAFQFQSALSPKASRTWAIAAGVDERALDQGLAQKRWSAKVDEDMALAQRLNVRGTPASFLNGIHFSGAQPYERFKEVLDAELASANAVVQGGVERDRLYAKRVAANYKAGAEDDDDDDLPKAKAAAAEAKVVHKVPVGASPTLGPATALVTIVEFSDFQCPYCKKVEETLTRIRREYGDKVRLVWRDLPLPFHPRAEPAAELARAARAQKGDAGFWAMHDLLYTSQPKLEESDLERLAGEAKLDVKKAMTAVTTKAYRKGIDVDVELGDDLKAQGTPHFFVNGRRFVGAQGFDAFKVLIDEEIGKAEALLRSGTARTAIYDALQKDGTPVPTPEKKALAAPPPRTPFVGNANAKIVIQEVGDFQCPFCARSEGVMDELMRTYPGQLKIVWRDKPLSMHPAAPLAAEAAREAFAQKGSEGFEKMRKALFANPQALGRADLDTYARTAGLDPTRFAGALDNHTHKAVIDADEKATTDAGVTGTPAFFVGPYYVSGAQAFPKFRRLVEALGGVAVAKPAPAPVAVAAPAAAVVDPSLGIKDVLVGTGRAVVSGDKVKVHYVGKLTDGTEFDQSKKRGEPFAFTVGLGRVIKGWDQGLIGMKVGGTRTLTIPAQLGYGARGAGDKIPPNSTLVFDIELISIE